MKNINENINNTKRRNKTRNSSVNFANKLYDFNSFMELTEKLLDKYAEVKTRNLWIKYDSNNIESKPKFYGKYLTYRSDSKINFEIWDCIEWAYNNNIITHWQEIKPPNK